MGTVGHGSHAVFWSETAGCSVWCGQVCKSPVMKWANMLKESSKKNSLKPNAASHNNASWSTDTDGLLEHSPTGGSLYYKGPALYKIIPGLGGFPLVIMTTC